MKIQNARLHKFLLFIFVLTVLPACAVGDARFTLEGPAGFWNGFWHGIISVVSLIIHIFNDTVRVYETNNIGGWYDFGFLIGVTSIWGGGCHIKCKSAKDKKTDKEWEEIGEKVEIKVMRKLKEWSEDEETTGSDPEWEDMSEKVVKKHKRKIREWAEKE